MEERGPGNVGDRAPDLLSCMNDVDPKGVDGVTANVIPVNSRDQDLALMVVDK